MTAKATLRVPERVLVKLRERSRQEGRSLNETALRALERGLGEESPEEGWQALGALVEAPPTRRFDPARVRRLRSGLGSRTLDLDEDLAWVRDDR